MSHKTFNEHNRTVNNKKGKGDADCMHKMKTIVNENVLRVALLAFNFIFLILSISLIALAIVYTQQLSTIKWYIGNDFISFPAVLLFLGSLSFVMSVAGCYSIKSRNKFFFIMFISTFTCLLILELAVAIIGFTNVNKNIEEDVKSIMTNQITYNDPAEKANFHEVEKLLGCCGINGPSDYFQTAWQEDENKCCQFDDCLKELMNNRSVIWYKFGCTSVVSQKILKVAKESASVATVCSILQLMEIACGVFLIHNLTKT